MTTQAHKPCPGCGAKVGQVHKGSCDVERCPNCGGQRISCGCITYLPYLTWSGEWPGVAECREFGWYAKFVPGQGWVRTTKDDPEAMEDLNRLCGPETMWDKKAGRRILRSFYELETRLDDAHPWNAMYRAKHPTLELAQKNVRDLRVVARYAYDIRIVKITGDKREEIELNKK